MPEVLPPPTATDVPPPDGLSRNRLRVLFAAPAVLFVLVWGVGAAVYLGLRSDRPAPPVAANPDGAMLFARHCANCHGEKGDGNGLARLDPPARAFGYEKFKLATTTNGIPTDDDLTRVLRNGIPGSAMHSFHYLGEAEHRALVRHVRSLIPLGMYAKLYREKKAKLKEELGEDPPAEELTQLTRDVSLVVEKTSRPGPPLAVPKEFPAATPQSLARGKEVFAQTCASCHGPEGKGDGQQVKDPKFKNDNGTPAKPRDLTAGVFKGGDRPEHLYARVRLGIPGTPMPATPASTVPEGDVLDLVNYVRSLSRPPGGLEIGTAVAGR
jgi:mono/diheme cytochrome c family protein